MTLSFQCHCRVHVAIFDGWAPSTMRTPELLQGGELRAGIYSNKRLPDKFKPEQVNRDSLPWTRTRKESFTFPGSSSQQLGFVVSHVQQSVSNQLVTSHIYCYQLNSKKINWEIHTNTIMSLSIHLRIQPDLLMSEIKRDRFSCLWW